ncbi:hypothetical protein [Demequina aestuarii]|nr:hypothetical protein [Demequina aestuarii]
MVVTGVLVIGDDVRLDEHDGGLFPDPLGAGPVSAHVVDEACLFIGVIDG